jgi:hypothetical protein
MSGVSTLPSERKTNMRTVMSFLMVLLFALLVGCESYAPTAPSDEQKAVVQSEDHAEECGTCGNPPPPGGGSGGGG